MYNELENEIEQNILESREKQRIIEQLKQEDHDFFSFFVCRNPVEKLLSIFDMKKEHFRLFKSQGKVGGRFFSWPQILSLWSKNWR